MISIRLVCNDDGYRRRGLSPGKKQTNAHWAFITVESICFDSPEESAKLKGISDLLGWFSYLTNELSLIRWQRTGHSVIRLMDWLIEWAIEISHSLRGLTIQLFDWRVDWLIEWRQSPSHAVILCLIRGRQRWGRHIRVRWTCDYETNHSIYQSLSQTGHSVRHLMRYSVRHLVRYSAMAIDRVTDP